MISKKTYDILKFIAQIALPALGTLYFALSEIWHLPYGSEIVGTVMAVDVFLGVLLGISTTVYNRSDDKYGGNILVIDKPDGKRTYSLELKDDPEPLAEQNEILFKIDTEKTT